MSTKTQPQTATLPSQLYAQAVAAGTLAADDNQQQTLPYLDTVSYTHLTLPTKLEV